MNVPEEIIVRKRRLAFNSDILVREGDAVRPDSVVAVTMLPLPRLFFLSAFRILPQGSPEGYLTEWLVSPGQDIELDDPIACFYKTDFEEEEYLGPGMVSSVEPTEKVFKSPLSGTIENIVEGSGLVMLREKIDYGMRRAVVQVGQRIGVWGRKLKRFIRHQKDEFVEKSQVLAQRMTTGEKGSPGEIVFARAPIAGLITEIDLEKGLIRLKRDFKEVELKAGFFGSISAIDKESITISAKGRSIQGICGIGGEAFGRLRVAAGNPDAELTERDILSADTGMVLVGGASITPEALKKANAENVGAIITGGADHLDLCDFLGRDFAVAITGREKAPFPVIITNQFGKASMDKELFEFFRQHEGSWVHVNSTTHMRAGVIRPEIIIMSEDF